MKRLLVVLGLATLSLATVAEEQSSLDQIKNIKGPGALAITGLERGGAVSFGGYFDTEFNYGDDGAGKVSNFDNHHLIIEMAAQLHPSLLFNTEIEYEHAGGELKIEQAWLDYTFSDAFTQRVGAVVVPFGRLNILHDSDVREMTDRSLYARYIVPTTWTDVGFGAHGYFDIKDIEVNYEGYVVKGLKGDVSATNGLRSARNPQNDDNNVDKAIVGRVGVSPTTAINVGVSGYYGGYTDSGNSAITMVGLDGEWKWHAWEFVGEYAVVNVDVPVGSATIIPDEMYGYYVEARYRTAPDFLKKAMANFKRPTLTYFARLGAIDTDPNNTTSATNSRTDTELTRFAFGFNVRPIEHVAYKIEYHINEEQGVKVRNNQVLASVAVGF